MNIEEAMNEHSRKILSRYKDKEEIKISNIPEINDIMIHLTVNYTTEHVRQLDDKKEIEIDGLVYEIVGSYSNDELLIPQDDIIAVTELAQVLTKTYILKLKRL